MLCARKTLRESPCWNCEYRTENCHSSCSAYKKWRLKDKKMKSEIYKKQTEEREVNQISRKNRNIREI